MRIIVNFICFYFIYRYVISLSWGNEFKNVVRLFDNLFWLFLNVKFNYEKEIKFFMLLNNKLVFILNKMLKFIYIE